MNWDNPRVRQPQSHVSITRLKESSVAKNNIRVSLAPWRRWILAPRGFVTKPNHVAIVSYHGSLDHLGNVRLAHMKGLNVLPATLEVSILAVPEAPGQTPCNPEFEHCGMKQCAELVHKGDERAHVQRVTPRLDILPRDGTRRICRLRRAAVQGLSDFVKVAWCRQLGPRRWQLELWLAASEVQRW